MKPTREQSKERKRFERTLRALFQVPKAEVTDQMKPKRKKKKADKG